MDGDLDDDRLSFLAQQAASGKQLVLLTHHQGIAGPTAAPNDPLYAKVVDCVTDNRPVDTPWYWYWGHLRAGYVHSPDVAPFRGRCAGHGAIPWGRAWGLDGADGIEWFEEQPSTIGSHRIVNGFALLTLAGGELTEQFIDETGAVSHTVAAPSC